MKVYLACSSSDLEIARMAMDALREAGHEITFDWTDMFEKAETEGKPVVLAERATADIQGVVDADVLVFYMTPSMKTVGCFIEIGAALAGPKPVLVCRECSDFDHFFYNHPWVYKVSTFGEILSTLNTWDETNTLFVKRGVQRWASPPKIPLLSTILGGETLSESSKE